MGQFRFPDGVEFLGDDGDTMAFAVSMPSDEDGYFGRECPACEQHFRMSMDDYDDLPDDLELWCVYCGHTDDHSDFMTQQQVDRTMRAVGDYAMQVIGDALDSSFKKTSRQSRRSGVSITYRSKPFYPEPLPDIDEERLVRERRCGHCQVRYAVFGEHRWCPVCGPLPSGNGRAGRPGRGGSPARRAARPGRRPSRRPSGVRGAGPDLRQHAWQRGQHH